MFIFFNNQRVRFMANTWMGLSASQVSDSCSETLPSVHPSTECYAINLGPICRETIFINFNKFVSRRAFLNFI